MKSSFMTLNLQDLLRGAAIAAGTSILVALQPILETGKVPDLPTPKGIGIAGLAAGIMYLGKNLLTNSCNEFGKKEEPPCPADKPEPPK